MRILHILDHSIPLHSGYTFRTRAILREQQRNGWQTRQVTSAKQGPTGKQVEEIDGLSFYRSHCRAGQLAKLPVLAESLLMLDLGRRIEEAVTDWRPDILHAHSPVLTALPAIWVARRKRLPVVYEVRAFWEDAAVSHGTGHEGDLRYRAVRGIESFALRNVAAITTICEGLKRDILGRGIASSKVTVIPNAVDLDEFPPIAGRDLDLERQLGLGQAEVLGFLGSFYHYEGLHLLLQAMTRLTDGDRNIRLLLVGGGPEEERLKRDAERLGLAGRVIFTGRIPHRDIARYYSLVDLLVYPRLDIRLTDLVTPLKPLEAMAQGIVLAASDVGGHRELIQDMETGYLFPPDDPDAMASKIRVALADRDRWPRMRQAGRRFVEQERNWRISVANYRDVYERLVKR